MVIGEAIGHEGFGPPRTFKQRRRRMSTAQADAIAHVAPTLGIPDGGALNPSALFAGVGKGPIVLDIGFGLGDSTFALAQARPHERVIGVEVHRPGVARLLALLDGAGLTNVRVACADAVEFAARLPDTSVDEVRAFCPDPWLKARHHKRRLVRPDILDGWARVLRPRGRVWIATDRAEYAQWANDMLGSHPAFKLASHDLHADAAAARPDTVYAARGRAAGRVMHDVLASHCP